MRHLYLSAPATLLLSAALVAQVPGSTPQLPVTTAPIVNIGAQVQAPGSTPTLPAIPGVSGPSTVFGPNSAAGTVLPTAMTAVMGNSNNYFGVSRNNQRYQQVFNRSQVGAAKAIVSHALRMRNATYTGPTQVLEHRLSHTTRTAATLTTNFASNITSTQTIVFTKKSYKYPNMVPNTTPSKFDIPFKYDKPFVWTNASGQNLLFETRNSSAASASYFVDAVSGNANVSRMWGTGPTAATGSLGKNFGLIIRIDSGVIAPPGVILPTAYATKMGNSNNIFGVAAINQRYHQVFTGAQVGSPKSINGHALRMRNATYTGPTQVLEHRLSHTTRNPATLTTSFASNITSTQTIVFTMKSYKYPNMVPNTTPAKCDIPFKYDKPFLWTAGKGQNLLLETRNTSRSSSGYYVDAASGDTNVSRMWGTGPTATSGTLGKNYGLVVKILTGTVSVPGTYTKWGAGCKGTGGSGGVVLPNAYTTKLGNSNNIYGVAQTNQRYHQVHSGAQVGAAGVIQGHSLRSNKRVDVGPTMVLEHRLSHSTRTPATLTTNFASNITSAQTIVFTKKAYKYPNQTNNANPAVFQIVFKYDKPFVWTAGKGQNLLLETRGTTRTGGSYFVDAQSGDANQSRMWSNTSSTAATGTLGKNYGIIIRLNKAGGGAVPVLSNVGVPNLGKNMSITLSMAKANSAAGLWLSSSRTKWGPFNLPLSLAAFGAPGCNLLVIPQNAFVTATNGSGNGSVNLFVPNFGSLLGVVFHNQYFILDGGANALGLAFSNGGTGTIGNQ